MTQTQKTPDYYLLKLTKRKIDCEDKEEFFEVYKNEMEAVIAAEHYYNLSNLKKYDVFFVEVKAVTITHPILHRSK
jgi:hypothetical protein